MGENRTNHAAIERSPEPSPAQARGEASVLGQLSW